MNKPIDGLKLIGQPLQKMAEKNKLEKVLEFIPTELLILFCLPFILIVNAVDEFKRHTGK